MISLNVAVWGVGKHAINRLIPALLSLEKINLVGVCSRNLDTLRYCRSEYKCYGWSDPKKMLQSSEVDIVCIATPIGLHSKHIMLSLKFGKHVWCEKPLTCDYEDTKLIVEIARKKNLMLTEGFMFLYHPQFKFLQNFVEKNTFRGIKSIVCRFGIPSLNNPGFRVNPSQCGGSFWDVGSYTVAAVLELLPTESLEILYSEINSNMDSEVDYEGMAYLKFSNGASGYLEWGIDTAYKNEIDIWCKDSSIFTEKIFSKPLNYKPKFFIRNLNGESSVIQGQISEQFEDMFLDYCKVYESSEKIYGEYHKILKRAKIMDKIFRSNKKQS